MTVAELIRALQEADPTGRCKVCIAISRVYGSFIGEAFEARKWGRGDAIVYVSSERSLEL